MNDPIRILFVNGPNLNLTGLREPAVYGSDTLDQINAEIEKECRDLGVEAMFFQSNSEGALIDAIHSVKENYDGCVLNAGAYTHYSYALRDAVAAVDKPVVEVHLSNPAAREPFRHTSVLTPVCAGLVAGMGKIGYILATQAICARVCR